MELSPGHLGLPVRDRKAFFCSLRLSHAVTQAPFLTYKVEVTEALSRRLKQPHFANAEQEALLSVIAAATAMNEIMDRLCEEQGITRAQYNVLRILRGVHPQGHARCEIACRMLDRAPDITRLVDRLQARRLVKRSRGSEDQRQAVTVITAKGLKLLEAMAPIVEGEIGSVLGKLSEQDCRELSRLCAVILESVQPATEDEVLHAEDTTPRSKRRR
jgi:DNA-binding MarR family transcriptional regulator